MDIKEVMLKRRSVREFTEQGVDKEDISCLLHYAMSGPSACNKQPWEFYVITNPLLLVQLRKASRFSNYNAPVIIIVAGATNRALPLQLKDYWIQDCSAAIENILLGATSMGLGAVWCGLLPQVRPTKKVQEILGLSEKTIPLGLIHLGYPLKETIPRDQYQEKYIHYYE